MSTKTDAPADAARRQERREHFETSSGIPLPNDFNPSNTEPVEYDRDLGDPGDFPYTRGVRRNLYRGRFWTMRQYAGYATAEESNARYKYLLSQGTTGLSVAFDLPTQIGLDSDDPLAAGEVGKVGVAIDSLEDMERLFEGIPLGRGLDLDDDQRDGGRSCSVSTSRWRSKQGVDGRQAPGHDPERHPQGVHRARHVHLPARAFACGSSPTPSPSAPREVPNWNTISISGYHIREAGSTAAQEVAFTLADAIAYVEAALAAGSEG